MANPSAPIVVGTDFSPEARHATQYAARLAADLGRTLLVVHAWNVRAWSPDLFSGEIPLEPILQTARAGAEAAVEAEVTRCRAQLGDVRGELVDGAASRVLPQLAAERGAELVVVGRRGHAGLAHVLLGSVSERVVRTASCPVLVVPESWDVQASPTRFVVGADLSGASAQALRAVAALRRALGARPPLLVVHAMSDERVHWLASWSEAGARSFEGLGRSTLVRWAEQQGLGRDDFEADALEGVAEEVLPRVARERRADWLVLGLQGRTPLATFLIGSTTRRVLEVVDRPVLVVPPSNAEGQEPSG